MPMAWACGGQIFDELSAHPTWRKVGLGDDGVVQALSMYHQMFNVDKSVQPSARSKNCGSTSLTRCTICSTMRAVSYGVSPDWLMR